VGVLSSLAQNNSLHQPLAQFNVVRAAFVYILWILSLLILEFYRYVRATLRCSIINNVTLHMFL